MFWCNTCLDCIASGWCEVSVDCSGSLFSRPDDPSRIVLGASLGKLLHRAIVEVSTLLFRFGV